MSKNNFENNIININNPNNDNKKANLNSSNILIKKNLTHRVFEQNQNLEKSKSKNKEKSKEKINFKIKVKKILDLNEFTYNNIANSNTTASNKNYNESYINDKNAFEKIDFDFTKNNTVNKFKGIKVKKSESKFEEKKDNKNLKNNKIDKAVYETNSLNKKEFPMFKNTFIINESININSFSRNNKLDIDTLPNLKNSEINTIEESDYDDILNSSLKKNTNKLQIKYENNNNNNCNQNINNNSTKNLCSIKETFLLGKTLYPYKDFFLL